MSPFLPGLVTDLADYPWSSYAMQGLGRADPLLTPLTAGAAIDANEKKRAAWWRKWLHTPLTERELAGVRASVVSGRPFGDSAWTIRTAARNGLPLTTRPRGRPRKSAPTKDSAGR